MSDSQVMLKPRKALPFFSRHPWVLDTAIAQVDPSIVDGQVVDLVSDKGEWIARGLFNSQSRIRVRLYTWNRDEAIDVSFWKTRIGTALELRQRLGMPDSEAGAVRQIFSEADFLSGLIVDQFAGHAVVQVNALAISHRLSEILPVIDELMRPQSISVRTDDGIAAREGIDLGTIEKMGADAGRPPAPTSVTIVEHGLRYDVGLGTGQKTGFYLDQRNNRLAAARYLQDLDVLDVCCYTGGFSLNAVRHGQARHVLGIDTSEPAIDAARAHARENGIDTVEFQAGDMFETLKAFAEERRQFGAVILDPPRFVRSRAGVDKALRAYYQLNRSALDVLKPGGILVTCSCSGNVSPELFEDMLFGVATKSRRDIQILEHRGPSPDHPVASSCPETQYLKCVICRVL